MKTVSANMQTHLDTGVTSLATCLVIVRFDGEVLRLCDHDQDIEISLFDPITESFLNGTYSASTGFERSAVQHSQDSVANAEATIILEDTGLSNDDVRAERYDRAKVYTFLVSWDDVANRGVIKMPGSGWIGDVESFPKKGIAKAEIRGIGQILKSQVGQQYTPTCRVDLFSSACSLISSDYLQHGVVTAVTGRGEFTAAISAAAFGDTVQTVHGTNGNWSFESPYGSEFQPQLWTDEYEAIDPQGPYRATTAVNPNNGTVMLDSDDQTGAYTIALDYEYGIISDEVDIAATPNTTDIDAGKCYVDLDVDIARQTGSLLDECRIGIRWLDGTSTLVYEDMSSLIGDQQGLSNTIQTFTRSFLIPSGARKFQVRIVSIKRDPAQDLAELVYDNIVVTAKATPVLAVGTNRDAETLSDYWDHGVVKFRSGDNQGISREVETFDDGTKDINLFLPLPFTPAVGDQFDIYPGCKHRWLTDCVGKYDNGVNFRGEPFVPGDDFYGTTPDFKAT